MSAAATTDTFTLGHSPDPDDAFMFYAMAAEKIDLRGHRFEHILQDIQTLNERATRGELHISAVSIHAYAYVLDRYALLPCGASMGDGYGPVVISGSPADLPEGVRQGDREAVLAWLRGKRIAVPGKLTSAFLALQIYCGAQSFDYEVVPFDQIFAAVREGKVDAGLIIHEGQLTYQRDGFGKVVDLGEWWKEETGLPLPLGGNVVRKDLSPALRKELSDILAESIDYGLKHRAAGVAHAMPLARDMDVPLADRFIGMYVNDYTRDYGDLGRRAIREFLGRAAKMGFIPAPVELEFVE
ncbi:MAG: ABC transporter substrate-binding protein [Verrucomicrobia bacterium]|nr:ABC transporter substrate-binding protein [Verrucomicrobiota bacterium]